MAALHSPPSGHGYRVPSPPSQAPRRGNAFLRWVGRSILRLGGWRIVGEFPDVPKLVLIVAPHSSAWDGIWGLPAMLALGVDLAIMGKRELFFWPLGPLLRWLGAFPVNRRNSVGLIEQVTSRFAKREHFWLALAPEGTRRRVEHWKTGFWRIARAADVPVLCAYFHYPDKVIGLGQLFQTSDDLDADMRSLREYYAPFVGKHRGTV
ncbi:MAG: lysophospholipid acyltransferase family protein [Lysobacteraceae bacterium]